MPTMTKKKGGRSRANDLVSKKREVKKRGGELFRSGWKNPKQIQHLVSREDDASFRFLVEWCEEFEEQMSKQRKRLSNPTPRRSARYIPPPEVEEIEED